MCNEGMIRNKRGCASAAEAGVGSTWGNSVSGDAALQDPRDTAGQANTEA